MIRQNNRKKYQFYQKCLYNKEEFNYLDVEEIDKLISCFKLIKDIPVGKILLKNDDDNPLTKAFNQANTTGAGSGIMYLVI
jgi:hypothetical protein